MTSVGLTFPCAACDGRGYENVTLHDETCSGRGACPCRVEAFDCEECDGTGSVRCAFCGEAPAVVEARGLGLLCEACANEETSPDE
jgi:hypothetical protein